MSTQETTMTKPAAAAALFLASIITANILAATFGLVPIGLGLYVAAGTFAAGFALYARDAVQDSVDVYRWGRLIIVGLILAGAALSWVVTTTLATPFPGGPSPARIAAASAVAFTISELADWCIYSPLRERSWAGAVTASNAVGGVIDSLIFLSLSGFGVTFGSVTGQWLAKMAVTLATVGILLGIRNARRVRAA